MVTGAGAGADTGPTLLIAPDKFRGTLTAAEFVTAAAQAAAGVGWRTVDVPMSDGGEGMVAAFGGANRTTSVTGPHGLPVEAGWRLDGDVAVIESAAASGLLLAGGADSNDPVAATSRGTGELIVAAVTAGARQVIVGLGGSAMTDGGRAAVDVIDEHLGHLADAGIDLVAACDVETVFTAAARVFGPQKGADPEQVEHLTQRLVDLQDHYGRRFGTQLEQRGIDLATVPGAGAAGGLGGGLLAIGGRLRPGLDVVADHVGLTAHLERVDAVVTGEGAVDAESFHGKVVGGVTTAARDHGLPVLIVTGTARDDLPALPDGVRLVDLSEQYGRSASWTRTADCVAEAVAQFCRSLSTQS